MKINFWTALALVVIGLGSIGMAAPGIIDGSDPMIPTLKDGLYRTQSGDHFEVHDGKMCLIIIESVKNPYALYPEREGTLLSDEWNRPTLKIAKDKKPTEWSVSTFVPRS